MVMLYVFATFLNQLKWKMVDSRCSHHEARSSLIILLTAIVDLWEYTIFNYNDRKKTKHRN
jgi:hypothetical protein